MVRAITMPYSVGIAGGESSDVEFPCSDGVGVERSERLRLEPVEGEKYSVRAESVEGVWWFAGAGSCESAQMSCHLVARFCSSVFMRVTVFWIASVCGAAMTAMRGVVVFSSRPMSLIDQVM